MSLTQLDTRNCSWTKAADAVGDKWSIMIIRDAFFGIRTFSAFERSLGIAKNVLSQRLDHLQKQGVIQKRPIGLGTKRFEYILTEKGRAFFPVLVALGQWGDEWILGEGCEPFVVADQKTKTAVKKIVVEAADGRVLEADDAQVIAGPGANKLIRMYVDAMELQRQQ